MTLTLRATGGGSTKTPACDPAEVRRAAALLFSPPGFVQLQALASRESRALAIAPAADVSFAVRFAEEWSKDPRTEGIYWSLNPGGPTGSGKGGGYEVGDITRRTRFLVDVDPVKAPEGKDLSATGTEKVAARALAGDVLTYLVDRGWPLPVEIDSGNGHHLVYWIDLANDDEARVILRECLKSLAGTFAGDTRGKIDVKVHNANRISKLPGTWARKGKSTPDRPHRMAALTNVPSDWRPVPVELLKELAGGKPPAPTLPLAAPAETNGHHAAPLVLRAPETIVERCRLYVAKMDPSVSGEGGHDSAWAAAQVIARGYDLGFADGFPILQEFNARCEPPWSEKELLHKWADARDKSLLPVGYILNRDQDKPAGKAEQPRRPAEDPTIYTLPQLLTLEFPDPVWAVPGLLSEGLSILAGKPKLGKSWFALNLAITVAAGGQALGSIRVTPGDVLYLCLEDRLPRVQRRARKVLGGIGCDASARLRIAVKWPRQNDGGLEQVGAWMASVERPTLVIVDVWAKFRPPSKSNGNQYEQDYDYATAFKSLMDEHTCSGLILHHTKKAAAEDVFDEISGTLGLTGAADGSMVLVRARNENEARLAVTGRDIDEKELALRFDPEHCVWSSEGTSDERVMGKTKTTILEYLKVRPGSMFTPAELADCIQMKPDTVRQSLNRLYGDRQVSRRGHSYYWPNDQPTAEADEGF